MFSENDCFPYPSPPGEADRTFPFQSLSMQQNLEMMRNPAPSCQSNVGNAPLVNGEG
jgi:hypothetical protein